MANYNPDEYDHGCADVTINSNTYTVTNFTDSQPPVEVDFQTGKGAHKDTALETGKRTGSLTIEVGTATTAPAMFETFDYDGQTWVIKDVGKAKSAGSPTTRTLALNWVAAAA